MGTIQNILEKNILNNHDILSLLKVQGDDQKALFKKSAEVKKVNIENKVYFRGLIEFSNICAKDCLYCGIRKSNTHVDRYNLTDDEIVNAAKYAHEQKYASVVLQSGELCSESFTQRIEMLLDKIHKATKGEIRITLSLGEQTAETYRRWFNAGGQRYLLRIETSNRELYERLHPHNNIHSFINRVNCLYNLKNIGFQTGTGVMIGLPFQTYDDLANDILFMKSNEIDMVGMGPYIEHADTPLFEHRALLKPLNERFELALKMVAVLRIIMPTINIAAATALQAIDKMGREKALKIGANIIMPNITPGMYRNSYKLYNNKPCTDENADDCTNCLVARIGMTGNEIGFNEWGDSLHYQNKN